MFNRVKKNYYQIDDGKYYIIAKTIINGELITSDIFEEDQKENAITVYNVARNFYNNVKIVHASKPVIF